MEAKHGMDWKKLLGSITTSVDQELRLRNEYLATENRLLRQQITGRVPLTDSDRKVLTEIGQQLGKQALEELATIAKPDTILAWYHKYVEQKGDSSQRRTSVGRPRIDQEVEDLVVRMAQENRSWGYDRIEGALANLGYTLSDQTVGNILKRHGILPAPQRKKTVTWREFIRIHMEVLGAADFFCEVWSWCALLLSSLLFALRVGGRWRHAMAWVAQDSAQWKLPLLPWVLDVPADGQRRGHRITGAVRLQPILCAASSEKYTRSPCPPPDNRAPRLQCMGQAVVIPAGSPRPVRDGPRQYRPRLGRPQQDDNRKAA